MLDHNMTVASAMVPVVFQIAGVIVGFISLIVVWNHRYTVSNNTKLLWWIQLLATPITGACGLKLLLAILGFSTSPVDLIQLAILVLSEFLPLWLALEMVDQFEIARLAPVTQKSA